MGELWHFADGHQECPWGLIWLNGDWTKGSVSLVRRGRAGNEGPASPLRRWDTSNSLPKRKTTLRTQRIAALTALRVDFVTPWCEDFILVCYAEIVLSWKRHNSWKHRHYRYYVLLCQNDNKMIMLFTQNWNCAGNVPMIRLRTTPSINSDFVRLLL